MILLLFNGSSIALPDNNKNPLHIAAWQYNTTQNNLEALTIDALELYGENLIKSVPEDINDYCPNYKKAKTQDRIKFWSSLISSLSFFESTHSTSVSYAENFLTLDGKPVVSRGLLQISIESSRAYQCQISSENDLHQPQINLECGVRILSKLITKDNVIAGKNKKLKNHNNWLGAAKYWSPFRDSSKKQTIALNTKKQPYCQ
ncbi:MAG: hypothetical protein AB8B80_15390 [Marinicellaceae bacterium]